MNEISTWQNLLIALIALNTLTKGFLDRKNVAYIKAHSDSVPYRFQGIVTQVDHEKAAAYSENKLRVGQMFRIYNLLIFCWFIFMGGLNSIDLFVRSFNFSPLLNGLIFIFGYSFVNFLLELPESLYSTFVLEERFGFNKTTPKIFVMDCIKSGVVGLIIGAPIFALILMFMDHFETLWWLYAWMLLVAFQMLMLFLYPKLIAPIFNKFTPLEEGEVKTKVEALLERAGFVSKGLFVMDASTRSGHGNAYFTGFGSNKRIVIFDTLLKSLEPDEIVAVLAHELGHFKKKHVLKMMCTMFIFSLIGFYILGQCVASDVFYHAHGIAIPSNAAALILFTMLVPVYTYFLTPIQAYFSRKREYEADAFAVQHADGEKLISALLKLHKENSTTLTPDPTYASFYYTHPSAILRIGQLDELLEAKREQL